MIFAIATTTLNKEVKYKLETGQYSKEEVKAIYLDYLKIREQREEGFRTVRLVMFFMASLFPILILVGAFRRLNDLVLVLFSFTLLFLILLPVYFLLYYLLFGRFKNQIHRAMKEYYADVIEEFKEEREGI